MTSYSEISLVASLIPAFIGFCAWRRRGKPGATALAALMWSLAIWGVVHDLEDVASGTVADTLYRVEQIILLAPSLFWFIFTIRYTGRERWLTRTRAALIAAAPIVALVPILTSNTYEVAWNPEIFSRSGDISVAALSSVALFWIHLAYRAFFLLLGSIFLLILLVNSQRLYVMQSLCLLAGYLGPWTAITLHQLEPASLALDAYLIPSTFAVSGLALTWALFRYRLLDISPVAHDALVEGMSDGTIVLDRQHRIMDLNPAAGHIIGCKASEVLGEDFRQVMSSRAGTASLAGERGSALIKRYEEHGQAHEEIKLGEGENERHYDVSLSALNDALGKRTGNLVVLHEITESKLAVERLDHMAYYDALTGLPNRAYFYERLSEEMARARRRRSLFALLFLDLDGFKKINDTRGHEVGDLLLKEAAHRIHLAVREYDFVSRLGGDEFIVILPEILETANAAMVAERIVELLAQPFDLAGNEARISTSIGVSFFPADGTESATLVKNADTAMYQAKQAGKNRYALFTKPKFEDPTRRPELEAELISAIDNNELTLFYRPEIKVSTSRVSGAEALLRWEHPERGLLHSEDFMPVAEEFDLTFPIERWVLREACRQIRSWQKRYPTETPLTVSVNLSSRHFTHPNLISEVSRILEETRIPPESLILEIHESVLGDEVLPASVTLQALKNLGVRLAVDDFGVDSTSLAQLMRSPLDVLKIDSSFISRIQSETEDGKIVSAIIALAHALGLRVVAQGVENPQQLMRLKDMGCDAVQGSYFADSLSHRETSAFLVADLYY